MEQGFFDKNLMLDTATLDPVSRHRVELLAEENSNSLLWASRYRNLFIDYEKPLADQAIANSGVCSSIFIHDYFERASGERVTATEIVREREGNDNLVVFPAGMRPHDIDLSLSTNSEIPDQPEKHISLSQSELDSLAYFVRDVKELQQTQFWTEKSPTLTAGGNLPSPRLETVSVDALRSFVMIFRRLYMKKEPGEFRRACLIYARRYLQKRLTRWVRGELVEYKGTLSTKARSFFVSSEKYTFSTKRLIDVFLYTQYAHQPSKKRSNQFSKLLAEVGDRAKFEWLFLISLRSLSCYYCNVHRIIDNELSWYLTRTGKKASFDIPPLSDTLGRGSQALQSDLRDARIQKHAEALGEHLWKQAGSPVNELPNYITKAKQILDDEEGRSHRH